MAYPGFRHIGLKILSIVLAALIWVLVAGEQIVERALRIPLEFSNLPAALEITGDPPDFVDVRVRGSSGSLSRVATGELAAVLDLRAARAGRRLFHVTAADVRAPFGVEVVQIGPSNISMSFEPSMTKFVPVVPEIEGDPEDGYVAGTVTAEPATVEVVGPASAVERLTEAITEPVSIDGATGNVTESVNIGVPDPSVRLQSPESASVTVIVTAEPLEWAVEAVPVKATGGTAVQILPATVTVYARGPRDARGEAAGAFEVTVDVEGLPPGQFQLPVRVAPPARTSIIRVEPVQVRVRIR